MTDSIKPIQVRLELIGQYPGDPLESPHGKLKTYPYLPRINDFIYYNTAWYQVLGVYMYPCEDEATHGNFGITLKVKYIEPNESEAVAENDGLQISDAEGFRFK